MAQDLYSQGYSQFLKEPLDDIQVKSQPPQWRAGYRAAEKNQEAKSKVALKPEKINRVNYRVFNVTWAMVCGVTSTPRFLRFHKYGKLYPLLRLMRNNIFNNRENIKTHKELCKAADDQLNILLQQGYDDGTLTKSDCAHYGYSPSA